MRVFEHPGTAGLFLEVYDAGRRKRIALGHHDREVAKAKAEEVATALRRGDPPVRHELTLRTLFDNYLREVIPGKSPSSRQNDRHTAKLFQEYFGAERKIVTRNRRDWDAFVQRRRQGSDGRVGKVRGKPVRDRVITQNLKTISAVLNWATMAGDGQGRYLLERNPFKGLPFPKEASPRRPILSDEHYQALLKASGEIGPHFELVLILAHETGHRIGSIRLLRWSDVDWDLCYLGGWKEPQTVLRCYQRPDESTMREALEGRKPLKALGG